MILAGGTRRSMLVTEEHLASFRRAFRDLELAESGLQVSGAAIDDLATRSGDTFIWHMQPGAVHRESALLSVRMESVGIDRHARLAHGALGLMHALRDALLEHPNKPIRGVHGVRFVAPVFEGAYLFARVEPEHDDTSAFVVTTNQLEPRLAITGRVLYGVVPGGYDESAFHNQAAQQLFTMEEVIGAVSALIGVGVEAEGARVLYMGQSLELRGLVSVGDRIEASAGIVDRRPGNREGERATARITVSAVRGGHTALIAGGESTFLLIAAEPPAET